MDWFSFDELINGGFRFEPAPRVVICMLKIGMEICFSSLPLVVFCWVTTYGMLFLVFSGVVDPFLGHLTSLPLDDRDRMPVIGDSWASVAGDYNSLPVLSAVYLGGHESS